MDRQGQAESAWSYVFYRGEERMGTSGAKKSVGGRPAVAIELKLISRAEVFSQRQSCLMYGKMEENALEG